MIFLSKIIWMHAANNISTLHPHQYSRYNISLETLDITVIIKSTLKCHRIFSKWLLEDIRPNIRIPLIKFDQPVQYFSLLPGGRHVLLIDYKGNIICQQIYSDSSIITSMRFESIMDFSQWIPVWSPNRIDHDTFTLHLIFYHSY